jgi:hypothetical protein
MGLMTPPQVSFSPSPQVVALSPGRIFLTYAYLQVLDVMTTMAFLLAGVQEANPLVRYAMHALGSPLAGLVAVKLAALLLGLYCWGSGRIRLLQRANAFFAVLVAWNLSCLVLGLGHAPRP